MIGSKLKSIHEKIALMESQLLLESKSDSVTNKIKSDMKLLKNKESEIKKQYGDKYSEALKSSTNLASKEIVKLKNGLKSLVNTENPNLLEKLSEYVFHVVGMTVGECYSVLSARKLNTETETTFEWNVLFASVFISNTALASAFIKMTNTTIYNIKTLTMIGCFIAPLTEEYAKRAALNISESVGEKYTIYFAGTEAAMYIAGNLRIHGGKIILLRLPAFFMHIFTTKFQSLVESYNSQELKYISYILAVIIHSVFNYVMIRSFS